MNSSVAKEWIGREIGSGICHRIEKVKVQEFCLAIGDKNSLYIDEQAARQQGYQRIPVPLTFQTSFLFWGYPLLYTDMREIGIDVDRMVHLKEQYQYHSPLYIGDTVTSSVTIADAKSGKINMVSFACKYHNQQSELCLSADFTIAIRPEQ